MRLGLERVTLFRSILCLCLLCALPARAEDVSWVWHSSGAPAQAKRLAVLLDHFVLSGDTLQVRRRMRMLALADGAVVTPVVHVQTDPLKPPSFNLQQRQAILDAMRSASRRSTSGWVQLDFEALESQREKYAQLVAAIRQQLPADVKLSVTALASWCGEQRWLDQVEADEVVPMFFRMGPDAQQYLARAERQPESLHPRCRQQAAGFARQESYAPALLKRYARRYWFNYQND